MSIIKLDNFAGLLQTRTTRLLSQSNELTRAINVNSNIVGGLQKRLGYSILGATVNAGQRITGLAPYYKFDGTTYFLATTNDGQLFRWDGATWGSISAALSGSTKYEMATFIDETFICGYNETARTFDTIRNLDNLTLTTTNNLTSAPNAKIPVVFRQRLYLIGITGRRSAFQFSAVPTINGTVITFPATNIVEVRTDDGEELISGVNLANRLVLFKNNTMHEWNENSLTQVANIGTTSHRSVINTGSLLFFFSRSNNKKWKDD